MARNAFLYNLYNILFYIFSLPTRLKKRTHLFVRVLFLEGIHRSLFSKLDRSFGFILMNGKTVNSLFVTVFFQLVYTWHTLAVDVYFALAVDVYFAFSWWWAQSTCRWSKISIGYCVFQIVRFSYGFLEWNTTYAYVFRYRTETVMIVVHAQQPTCALFFR